MFAVIQLAIAAITAKIADVALPDLMPVHGCVAPRLLAGKGKSGKVPAARYLPQRPLGKVLVAFLASANRVAINFV